MEKIKILLDTDLGSDCDDAGALAVLHNLADKGKAEILAITHCGSEISGAVAIYAINEWYKRRDMAVGRFDKGEFLEGEKYTRYTKPIMEKYLQTNEMPEIESSVRVLRKALSHNNNVTIAVIGMMNNIALLLKSEPDDISPLNGIELVKSSVKNMYVMGGNFEDLTLEEYNIKCDIESAKYVSQNFPVPVIYCGFEIGVDVLTGKRLESADAENPVKFAYQTKASACGKQNCLRNSWDPITVYCAVIQDTPLYRKSEGLNITFDDFGKVLLEKGGKDSYLIANAQVQTVQDVIDELVV